MTYNEIENILRNLNDSELPQIYHFDGTPAEAKFEQVFDFYSTTLKNFSDYGFDPVFIYFNQLRSKNAFACKRNQYSIVSFNSGLIVHLLDTFDKTSFVTVNPALDALLDTKINTLMYQSCLHFTLYHEMAHLVQKSRYLVKGLNELHQASNAYDEERHLLELDADQFSSLCVGSHVNDYLDRIDPLKKTPELEDHVITITIAALMVYVLSFYSSDEKLYFREHHHPHPSIRLSSIAQTVIDYTYQARKGRSANSMERTDILVQAGNIVQNSTKTNTVLNFVQILVDNYNDIKTYLDSFTLIKNSDMLLATDKWNEKAK